MVEDDEETKEEEDSFCKIAPCVTILLPCNTGVDGVGFTLDTLTTV